MIGFVLAAVLATSFTGPEGDWLVENRGEGPVSCSHGLRMGEQRVLVAANECRMVPMTAGGISCVATSADRTLLVEARTIEEWVELAGDRRMSQSPCVKAVTINTATLGTRGEVHAYNSAELPGWCADKPGPKKDGQAIPADGGWRTFSSRPAWCTPGVVIETPEEHKAHGTRSHCPKEAAMWDVAMRKTERECQRKQGAQ